MEIVGEPLTSGSFMVILKSTHPPSERTWLNTKSMDAHSETKGQPRLQGPGAVHRAGNKASLPPQAGTHRSLTLLPPFITLAVPVLAFVQLFFWS